MFITSLSLFIVCLILLSILFYINIGVIWFVLNNLRFFFVKIFKFLKAIGPFLISLMVTIPKDKTLKKKELSYLEMVIPSFLILKGDLRRIKFFKFIMSLFLVVNIFLFLLYYSYYTKGNVVYSKARPYYIVANLVNFWSIELAYRTGSPSMILNFPQLRWMKQRLFDKASQHIPAESGERAYWESKLFFLASAKYNYPYHPGFKPGGKNTLKIREKFMNHLWYLIERTQVTTIADKEIEKEILKDMHELLAYYYNQTQSLMNLSSSNMLGEKGVNSRRDKILMWTKRWLKRYSDLDDGRSTEGRERVFFTELLLLSNMDDIIISSINKRMFSCSSPILREYQEIRNSHVKSERSRYFLKKVLKRKIYYLVEWKYNYANSYSAEFTRRVLEKYCGLEIYGKSQWCFSDILKDNFWYEEEKKILKEMFR